MPSGSSKGQNLKDCAKYVVGIACSRLFTYFWSASTRELLVGGSDLVRPGPLLERRGSRGHASLELSSQEMDIEFFSWSGLCLMKSCQQRQFEVSSSTHAWKTVVLAKPFMCDLSFI